MAEFPKNGWFAGTRIATEPSSEAASYISKAISLDGTIWKLAGGSIKLSDEAGSGSSAEVGISHGLDRWAKEIQSEFVYTKFRAELVCGGLKVVRAF